MANELRVRAGFLGGLIEDNPLASGATTLTSAALAAMPAIGTTQHLAIILDPDGLDGAPEIAYVTAHSAAATTATILRAQEGSTARAHSRDIPWVHGPTVKDFTKWSLVVDEPGTSLANWTTVTGTWAANAGGYIEQTDTTLAYRVLAYTPQVDPGAGLIAEAEVRFPAAATASRRAMLSPGGSAVASSTSNPWAGLVENTDAIVFQQGDVAADTYAITVDEDVWYRITVRLHGGIMALDINGVFVKAHRVGLTSFTGALADRFALVNYVGAVHYRNIKLWRLSGLLEI